MRRSLTYFWPIHLAVVAGAAVATAVLAGSLIVGDSIRASLRDLTLERLGRIEQAVTGERLFAAALAERLGQATGSETVPLLALRGAAVHATSGARAARVGIWGIDERFAGLFPGDAAARQLELERRPGQIFPSLAINAALARELSAEPGDEVLIQFEGRGEVPRATLLGDSDPTASLRSLRLTVTAVLPDSGAGRFSLAANQTLPLNAFLQLSLLQRRLERPDEVNAALLAGAGRQRETDATSAALTDSGLRQAIQLADVGLRLLPGDDWLTLESREFVLRPPVAEAVLELAAEQGRATLPILTYLANRLQTAEGLLPYSTVTALPLPVPDGLGTWRPNEMVEPRADWPELAPLVLNRWAADKLRARPGDRIRLTYFEVGADDALATTEAEFQMVGVLPMTGLGADRSLTPDFPGIAERIADWDPPFPGDLSLVGPADEEYWHEWRGAPKAFVPLAAGQELWRSRFGELTAIRVGLLSGEDVAAATAAVGAALARRLSPGALGLTLLPVREQGLAAASGTTSFAGLFVGFSLFLIVSSALLVALLFQLGVERRAGELGLRLAAGFALRSVRRMLLAEGAVLAVLGGLLGIGLAALYGRAVLAGLSTWWAPILSSPFLRLDLRPASLATGFLISLAVVLGSIALTLRRLRRLPARALLAGVIEESGRRQRAGGMARRLAPAALVAALLLLGIAWSFDEASPALFFGVGAALLTAGFAAFALWCRGG